MSGRRQFGNVTLLKEESRAMWGWNWLDALARDIRYSVRQFSRSPGFAGVVIATLGLGVGGNTAIFSILRGVLLRPLPYHNPNRLVALWEKDNERQEHDKVTGGDYAEWKSRNQRRSGRES